MHDNSDIIITTRNDFSYRIRRQFQKISYKILGPVKMAKIYYRIVMKRRLNLKNPSTFTEKINWYKLFYCPYNPLIIKCCDKFGVRDFLDGLGLKDYQSNLIGVWSSPYDINWNQLPEKFALKSSNGCGYNIICKNKNVLDEHKTKKLLNKWLKENFGVYNAEPHYNVGEKRIICEEYIDSGTTLPVDYKIHCMNGVPSVIQVCDERTSRTTNYTYYNANGQPLKYGICPSSHNINLDDNLKEDMLRISKMISSNFPYVRVDFFINNGHLQISELTFTPSAGLKPDLLFGNGDNEMGKILNIRKLMQRYDTQN